MNGGKRLGAGISCVCGDGWDWFGELSEHSDLVCGRFFAVVVGDVFGPSGGGDAVRVFVGCFQGIPSGVGEELVIGGVLLECGCFESGDVNVVPEIPLLVECVIEGTGEVCGVSDE